MAWIPPKRMVRGLGGEDVEAVISSAVVSPVGWEWYEKYLHYKS